MQGNEFMLYRRGKWSFEFGDGSTIVVENYNKENITYTKSKGVEIFIEGSNVLYNLIDMFKKNISIKALTRSYIMKDVCTEEKLDFVDTFFNVEFDKIFIDSDKYGLMDLRLNSIAEH